MGKRGRPPKVNQEKKKAQQLEEELEGSPVERVVATLRKLGFGPGDVDLGQEVVEAIEAMVGSPIVARQKVISREEAPSRREVIQVPDAGVAAEKVIGEPGVLGSARVEELQPVGGKGSGTKKLWADEVEGEKQEKKAWADVVKGQQTLHPDQKLQYFPPAPEGVIITEEDCREGMQYWQHSLVGYAIGQKPGFKVIQRYVNSLWKNAIPQVHQLSQGVFLFRFKSGEEMESILSSRWTFNRAPLILQKWNPKMRLDALKPERVAVWVRLSGLELYQWSSTVLSKITSFIGRPIQSDLLTAVRDRISFARVLVEVDINSKLPDAVPLITEEGASKISVLYEWYPAECPNCLKWGHKELVCPGKKEQGDTRGKQTGKQVGDTQGGQQPNVQNRMESSQQGTSYANAAKGTSQQGPSYANAAMGTTKVWQAKATQAGEEGKEKSDRGNKENGGNKEKDSQAQSFNETEQMETENAELNKEAVGVTVRDTHSEVPDPPPLQ